MPLYFQPQELMPLSLITKTADESRSSTTTLTDDDELTLPVEANSTYDVKAVLIVQGETADTKGKAGWSYPTGTTIKWTLDAIVETAGSPTNSVHRKKLEEDGDCGFLCDSGVDAWYEMKGLVTTGSTAGDLTVTWAQQETSTNATKVLAQSYLQHIKTA